MVIQLSDEPWWKCDDCGQEIYDYTHDVVMEGGVIKVSVEPKGCPFCKSPNIVPINVARTELPQVE